jgi:P22_AR N-terminal domain
MDEQRPEQRALAGRDHRNIAIRGDQSPAVRTRAGSLDLPLRALCAILGLCRPAQVRRIPRDAELREDFPEIPVETGGGLQTLQALRVEVVPFWLAGVTVSKVKPQFQEKLRAYRKWVVRTVDEAFLRELGMEVPETKTREATEIPGSPSTPRGALPKYERGTRNCRTRSAERGTRK